MCTAVAYTTRDRYFGRTLDVERSYSKTVTVTPRKFKLPLRTLPPVEDHHAIIGMATVEEGYPLYYDAVNEHGLAMAALSFPQNAVYFPNHPSKLNLSPFELIPYLLSCCRDLYEARRALEEINVCSIAFSEKLPLTPLHWLISHRHGCITVESVADGLKIYENPVEVLTNNPPFDYHMTRLRDHLNLTAGPPENRFGAVDLTPYSLGMGAVGLPGDLSSSSRFVRAAFVKLNSLSDPDEAASVSQLFHILGSVAQPRGCTQLSDGRHEITEYTCCINTDRGIYYYTTYENHCISALDMHKCDLDATELFVYPLATSQIINRQN